MLSRMKVTQCQGEGQGQCKRCMDNGKWNMAWTCFLYKIDGLEGCYCRECVKKLQEQAVKNEEQDGQKGD